MTRPEPGTEKAAAYRVRELLGAARMADIGNMSEGSVHRMCNPNEPHVPNVKVARDWDRECADRYGEAPFTDLFQRTTDHEANAEVARRLRQLADDLEAI